MINAYTLIVAAGAGVAFTGLPYKLWKRYRGRVHAALLPKWVPEAAEGTMPRVGSRRWARALYHNKFITIEELNSFYASNPENFRDPDR